MFWWKSEKRRRLGCEVAAETASAHDVMGCRPLDFMARMRRQPSKQVTNGVQHQIRLTMIFVI
jgi:hypothetical protein